jgi:hypothetical protein
MREKRNACMVLVGKPEDKKRLERPRCRWHEVIEMDFEISRMGGSGLN